MAIKTSHHLIKGMNKDLSKSKFSSEFAYDARNIRITAREEETLLTVTNEKGNNVVVNFPSTLDAIHGYCVLNSYLVVFATTPYKSGTTPSHYDIIYRVDMTDYSVKELFRGDLNFSKKIETLGVYENAFIQKVYWVDGVNQPRVINIVKDDTNYTDTSFDFVQELSLEEEVTITRSDVSNSVFSPGTIQYAFTYYNKYGQESNIFYITELMYTSHTNRGASPEDKVSNSFNIEIKNPDTKFDYVRVYSIHRTSIDSVPVVKNVADIEISVSNGLAITGGHKEFYARAKSGFDITVNGSPISDYSNNLGYYEFLISERGDYYAFNKEDFPDIIINIGSGFITWGDSSTIYISKDSVGGPGSSVVPIIHAGAFENNILIASDIKVIEPKVSFTDIGTSGVDIDPTQLLYIGGESVVAETIAQKDQTLFLGNITLDRESIPQEVKSALYDTVSSVSEEYKEENLINDTNSGYYSHSNSLGFNTASFKIGEHYRLGVQFQHKSGKWSEPVFIGDYTVKRTYKPSLEDKVLKRPVLNYTIPSDVVSELRNSGYRKARTLVVFPTLQDRKVILQGMLCPTVFNLEDRNKNAPYAQSSWFTRPFLPHRVTSSDCSNTTNVEKGAMVEFRHWYGLFMGNNRGAEIQASTADTTANYNIGSVNNSKYSDIYMVDQSVLTMHSPDIEFDDNIAAIDSTQFKLQLVGLVNFTASIGDIDIQTSSPTVEPAAIGFVNKSLGNFKKLTDEEANTHAAKSLVSGLFYRDYIVDDSENASEIRVYPNQIQEISYMVYPWHRSGSLNNDFVRPADKGTRTAVLKKKRISNLKFSESNTWLSSLKSLSITQVQLFNSNEVSLIKIPSPANSGYTALNYYGNVDTIVTPRAAYNLYIDGEPCEGGAVTSFVSSKITTMSTLKDIGDFADRLKVSREPVRLKYKSAPHLVFSLDYNSDGNPIILPAVNGINNVKSNLLEKPFWLTGINDNPEQSEFTIIKFKGNIAENWDYIRNDSSYSCGDLLIDATSWDSSRNGYLRVYNLYDPFSQDWQEGVTPMYMGEVGKKFKYTDAYGTWYYELNYLGSYVLVLTSSPSNSSIETYGIQQDNIYTGSITYPYLFLAELVRDNVENAFGGTTDDAIKENQWLPSGLPVTLKDGEGCSVQFTYGDTWYQRYDCLKTYAFTPEDENQVVEIASFMCETRVNIDGRYDKNRGQVSNLNMSPTNFNKLNPIYTQKDNFFNYRILDKDYYRLNAFPTTITWSKEKSLAEQIDTWANITMANTLDLDGDKGKINALRIFNNEIFCFQDSGISNILFNSRVQIPSSDGVPIEISNGYKVDGKRYLSNTIGCKNKWSIAQSPNGLYFLDEDSNSLYLFNGQLDNISAKNGMETWVKDNKDLWYGTFYDKNNGDVYFTTSKESLVYSEKLAGFTSFMSYGNTDFMFNVGDDFYAIYGDPIPYVWKQFAGDYNNFYGVTRPYSITIISNQDMPYDKIFNNVEFRADSWNNDTLLTTTFDKLEVWNEYQYGSYDSTDLKGKNLPSWLKKKFRVWRANVPRDSSNGRDRIRNPWAYIKLSKEHPSTERTELHDIMVHYFI